MKKWIVTVILSFFMLGCISCKANEVSIDNLESIIKLVIDSSQIESYYHTNELPNRKPLRIALEKLNKNNINLVKFNMPVEFVSSKNRDKNLPYLFFSDFNIDKNTASIKFTYSVEGVYGNAEFKRVNLNWQIEKIYLFEK